MCRSMSALISSASTRATIASVALVGVAPALHEIGRQPGLLHRHGDRFAPAMNDHGTHPHRLHEYHVDQQGTQVTRDLP